MIPIGGMSSFLGLKLADRTEDIQKRQILDAPQHDRAIAVFRERIGGIETVDQLIEDRELFAFVMRAFDLEDQIFGKALIRKMLKSDVEDRQSLINRLTDPRFREMYDGLGFGPDGVGNPNTILKDWQESIVDRYVDTLFVNALAEQNETVGAALEFRRKAGKIEGPFDILKDKDLAQFMRTVLGLPAESAQVDIDRQAKFIEQRLDLEKLQDPAEVERLIVRYALVSDALSSTAVSQSAAVQMLSGSVALGSERGFLAVTFDIAAISSVRATYF